MICMIAIHSPRESPVPIRILPLAARLGAAFTLAAAFTGPLGAAPSDDLQPEKKKEERLEDRLVPIPSYSPDVTANGCRARKSPEERVTTERIEIPFWSLIDHATGRYSVHATIKSPEKFAEIIAPLDADLRTLVLLHALSRGMGADGIHTYFFLSSETAPIVRDALKNAGLHREYDLFTRAIALFGDTYPVDEKVRESMFGYSKQNAALNDFDRRLLAISNEFGTREELNAKIISYVNRTPALWQRIENLREKLGDGARLEILVSELANIDLWKPFADVKLKLDALTKAERSVALVAIFNAEFENGGVNQFFYNSEGSIAPEIHDALLEIGLERQGGILKRGIGMFGEPYPRDTQSRRDTFFGDDEAAEAFNRKLVDLTDEFYALDGGPAVVKLGGGMTIDGGPGIRHAMVGYAQRNNMLPC
jgi:hypothetical protein